MVSTADETAAATSSEPSSSLPSDAEEATAAGGEDEDFFEGAADSDGFKRGGGSSSSVPDCSPPCALLTLRRFDEDPGAEAEAGGEDFGDGDGFRWRFDEEGGEDEGALAPDCREVEAAADAGAGVEAPDADTARDFPPAPTPALFKLD